jgi:hypothetical protein
MEYKGNLLIKKFLLTDDLTQQLWTHDLVPPSIHGLPRTKACHEHDCGTKLHPCKTSSRSTGTMSGQLPAPCEELKRFHIIRVDILWAMPKIIITSLNTVPHFTEVPTEDACKLLRWQLNEDNVRLITCPSSHLFQQSILQTSGWSPSWRTSRALSGTTYKYHCWLHYVGNISVI